MSTPQPDPVPSGDAPASAATRRHRSGFWAVAFAFLIVMASATLPSPLYGLYRERDGLSAFTVTVIYAIYAGGTIATLLSARFVAARIGRRGMMLSAVATMMAAAGLLAAWKALPGLLVGRFITGVAVGLAAGTAITYLIELRVREDPKASVIPARNIGTGVNVGALGIGPLIAGFLAEWVRSPLTLPYLLWVALGAIALIGLVGAPETGTPAPVTPAEHQASSSSRPVRLLVPAALATLAAFAANGLFAGLSGLFLAITFHHSSHALAGATLFLVFAAGVASQLASSGLPASRVFVLGTISMLIGLALLVTAVRLSAPSLALFLISGALIGAGAGALFKGTTGLVLDATAPENRLAMTSDLLIALFVGLSIPVIGAGVALDRGASPPDTVLGFAIVVGLGVAGTGALLGHALRSVERPTGAASVKTPHPST
jgi:Major Facilitator Superfamily